MCLEYNMEDDFWRSLLYFFSGVFSYRLLTSLLNYNQMYASFYDNIISCLEMLASVDDSICLANNYKYEDLEKTNIPEGELEDIKQADRTIIATWRQMVIVSILKRAPRHYRLSSKFTTWNQAMSYRDSHHKRD